MLITEEYRRLNAQLHESNEGFGATAHKYADTLARTVRSNGITSVLDYGCGKCTLKPALQALIPDLPVIEYDPAFPDKSSDPMPQDMVVIFDVMEHIEPDCLDSVLAHIQSKAIKGAIFLIANEPAHKFLPDGRNAHLIVKGMDWWKSKIGVYFDVLNAVQAGPECMLSCARKLGTALSSN